MKNVTRIHGSAPGRAGDRKGNTPGGKLTEGVPLAKLVKREMIAHPELVMLSQPRSIFAERFRRLKTSIAHQFGDAARVIVVTSGAPGEGKSTVAANLALAFAADGGDKTLLIDGDFRRPTVGRWLHPAPQLGFAEVLAKRTGLDHAILSLTNSTLEVLPAGDCPRDPLELIASQTARAMLAELRRNYARIVIDTPPVVPFTDADAMGAMADGVLMVVRAGATPKSVYRQALSSITSTRILGSVFNDAPHSLADGGRYYDKYYTAYYDKKREDK